MFELMLNKEEQKIKLREDVYSVEIPGQDITFGDIPFYVANEKLAEKDYQAKINNPDGSVMKDILKKKRPQDYIGVIKRFANLSAKESDNGLIAKASIEYERHLKSSVTSQDIYIYFKDKVKDSIEKSLDYCLW